MILEAVDSARHQYIKFEEVQNTVSIQTHTLSISAEKLSCRRIMTSVEINGREKANYVLGRRYEASARFVRSLYTPRESMTVAKAARLHHQHYMLHELTGYSIHPQILPVREDSKIADVGCGTG